jgi:hypothetical protein
VGKEVRTYLIVLIAGTFLSSCSYRFYSTDCSHPIPGRLIKHTVLDSSLSETSGLLFLKDGIWTFNDSGGEAALYCVDQNKGSVIRKTVISNALNVDWEDITADENFIYVADVGNNFAWRDTILIYRIPRKRLESGDSQVNHSGVISVSFKEEIELNSGGFSSHDCEALFAFKDSLYLFTKNWVDESTSVYVIPSFTGHYTLSPRYRYEARILVTGADLYPGENEVALVGYRNYQPIVIRYTFDQDPSLIGCGGKARIYPFKLGRQVEGVCFDPSGDLIISSERSVHKATLFKVGSSLH